MPRLTGSIALPFVAAALLAAWPAMASAQAPFRVGPVSAGPGTIARGTLEVAAHGGDPGASIPVTVVHGATPGPVLALVAGVHGMEYTPILALQRLGTSVDPRQLRGTLVLVHVANMPSFLGRTVYYSPVDGKNLNRVFPGRANGTLSDRIADVLTREVIAKATHLVDVHCGDGNEWLRPYTYWMTSGAPEVVRVAREMALAFGLDHIVIDTERPTDASVSVYLANTAVLRGTPALTVESGGLAGTDEPSIARIERGAAGLMRYLGMRPDGPEPVTHPVWIGPIEVLRSSITGILHPQLQPGYTVTKGALVAYVTDFHGTRREEIRAPFDGEVLYVVATPPITKGEPVGAIGQRAAAPDVR